MSRERRSHLRLPVRIVCSWSRGARVTDLGMGGCFVRSRVVPGVGDTIALTVSAADGPLLVRGEVVHTRRGMGFAIRFGAMGDFTLQRMMALLLTVRVRRA